MGNKKKYDKTSTLRAARRTQQLNELAQKNGYKTMSNLLTAWKNGSIKVVIIAEHTTPGEKDDK